MTPKKTEQINFLISAIGWYLLHLFVSRNDAVGWQKMIYPFWLTKISSVWPALGIKQS